MRVLIIVFAILLIVGIPALAEEQPRVRIFSGYSYLYTPQEFSLNSALPHTGTLSGKAIGGSNQNGWNASLAYNMTRNLALVADTSGYYQSGRRDITFWGDCRTIITESVLQSNLQPIRFSSVREFKFLKARSSVFSFTCYWEFRE